MSIYEKLMNVQQKLDAPKDQFNKFGGYKYRSCESILGAVKPILKEQKLVINLTDEVTEISGRHYIVATATVVDVETGEKISTTAFAREEAEKKGMDASQITGAASSYARKYALNGLLAIDDQKDSDATNETPAEKKAAPRAEKKAPVSGPDGSLRCENCGSEISSVKVSGEIKTPQEVAARGLEKHGKQLCWKCQKDYAGTSR